MFFHSLHPEVLGISLLILPYAGKSIFKINYTINYLDIIHYVTPRNPPSRRVGSRGGAPHSSAGGEAPPEGAPKALPPPKDNTYNLVSLNWWPIYGQSAGNWKYNFGFFTPPAAYAALTLIYNYFGIAFPSSSETLRKNLIVQDLSISLLKGPADEVGGAENIHSDDPLKGASLRIKFLSEHLPTHKTPLSDKDFGYYLAGLIDGAGCFELPSRPGREGAHNKLVISFYELDISLAYYIKDILGFGNVSKVKDKRAFTLIVAKKDGLIKVLNLINGKFRSESKLQQIKKMNYDDNLINPIQLDLSKDLNNYWLAGFADADASFQIKILHRKERNYERHEIRLNFQVDQKNKYLLELIKNEFGGSIGHRKKVDCYYYGSVSFGSAFRVIQYFSKYHLLGTKYLNYIKWRKAYLIIQKKEHLTEDGFNKIKKLKYSMNSYSSETFPFTMSD